MRTYMTFQQVISAGITSYSAYELWSLANSERLVSLPRKKRQKWRIAVENNALVWNDQPIEEALLDTRVFTARYK